ncbi:MAG: hypothetical protein MJE68_33620 [Proteobacteria bacterium]|nr:hypothetical protein [Pseudomonadota bacterium]
MTNQKEAASATLKGQQREQRGKEGVEGRLAEREQGETAASHIPSSN